MDAVGFSLLMMLFCFLIMVGISRWIFRVNDIVKRLDSIVSLLKTGIDGEGGSK